MEADVRDRCKDECVDNWLSSEELVGASHVLGALADGAGIDARCRGVWPGLGSDGLGGCLGSLDLLNALHFGDFSRFPFAGSVFGNSAQEQTGGGSDGGTFSGLAVVLVTDDSAGHPSEGGSGQGVIGTSGWRGRSVIRLLIPVGGVLVIRIIPGGRLVLVLAISMGDLSEDKTNACSDGGTFAGLTVMLVADNGTGDTAQGCARERFLVEKLGMNGCDQK